MALVRWDPTRELDALQGDMNRLFDSFFQGRGNSRRGAGGLQRWIPPMDLTEDEQQFVLRADLPGVERGDVDIEVKDDVLTISGERRSEHEDKGEGFYRMERSFGRFSRSIDLPSGVEAGAVSADFENGVLEVRIPKPAQAQPTKVAIGAGAASENGSE
jgi:HSP20 family protein